MSSARAVPDPKVQSNNNYINRNSPCTVNLGRSPNDNYHNNFMKRSTPRKSIDRCGSPSLSGYPGVRTPRLILSYLIRVAHDIFILFLFYRMFEEVRLIIMDHHHRMAIFHMILTIYMNTKLIINISHIPVTTTKQNRWINHL